MPPARAHIYWNGAVSVEENAALSAVPLPPALSELLRGFAPEGDHLPVWLRFDQSYYLPDDILAKVDHMSMAHSIEVRPPYLDHRIVEFAASLPAHLKAKGSAQKIVLRELMHGKLPASTLRRKKVGFDFPAHEWLRCPLRTLMLDTLLDKNSGAGLFRRDALEDCVQRHLSRRANLGYHLWGLMLLFLWMRRWGIQTNQAFETHRTAAAGISTSI